MKEGKKMCQALMDLMAPEIDAKIKTSQSEVDRQRAYNSIKKGYDIDMILDMGTTLTKNELLAIQDEVKRKT